MQKDSTCFNIIFCIDCVGKLAEGIKILYGNEIKSATFLSCDFLVQSLSYKDLKIFLKSQHQQNETLHAESEAINGSSMWK